MTSVTDMQAEDFYTVRTLGKRLGLSKRSVHTLLAKKGPDGKPVLKSYKVEGSRRIDPADVDSYLVNRCTEEVE